MSAEVISLAAYRQARMYRDMSEALDRDDSEFAQELAFLSDVFDRKSRDHGEAALARHFPGGS